VFLTLHFPYRRYNAFFLDGLVVDIFCLRLFGRLYCFF
jgi:hypothetical protein